ncbi:nicotinate-nucleotide diphosphorylase [Dictyostelium purpureum]|uniref:Nicotinate-nucleotide pyrophosphorylase [carboxylating] n=1 Tax=Dictyostelium purpureum TaxID=5786 RepID=F1A556_DICPU|nr:nicotinate-nucleotide diphosphorylase [Dictyostelium purpureum]EGC28675.1 nicotinate-nucleotide diphosphorylase [Dictyostelium purpureum]|eukprot:XP_003294799.1 nicotinate-nucleotide diphosphorylase [Dictyostelium purpureum]
MELSLLIPNNKIEKLIKEWLEEDIPSFDYGGVIVGSDIKTAHLLGKQTGVFSGKVFFDEIFRQLGCSVKWFIKDGEPFTMADGKPQLLAIVEGPCRNILIGERLSLNILSRSCAVTTQASAIKKLVDNVDWKGKVAGTRKTTPGFRLVEKLALLVAGLDTHRMDLSSMIMLKDNHIWACGNITQAVKNAHSVGGFSLKIEVECRNQDEAIEAIEAGADIVMLDNFNPQNLNTVSTYLKQHYPHIKIEASGGITVQTIQQYAISTIDIISMGNLTQGVPHIDISLKIQKNKQ